MWALLGVVLPAPHGLLQPGERVDLGASLLCGVWAVSGLVVCGVAAVLVLGALGPSLQEAAVRPRREVGARR